MNLAIIRLASCCGLRASEIAGLRFGDVHTGITRPFLSIRGETAKGGKPRRVVLILGGLVIGISGQLDRYRQYLLMLDPRP